MNKEKITIAMGSQADGWVSSELYFSYLLGALKKINQNANLKIEGWSSKNDSHHYLRRRWFYPRELARSIQGNLHLIDQSYADSILCYHEPAIVTVADTFFWKNRSTNPLRSFFRKRIINGLQKSLAIIAISSQTANELKNDLKIPDEKIFTIPFSINSIFFTPADELPKEIRNKISSSEFILHVGSLDQRKGFDRLVDAYSKNDDFPPLVQVGGVCSEDLSKKIYNLNLSCKIIFLGRQPMNILHSLYAASSLFIFPSIYEGYGVSPVEARAAGAKILTTPMPSVIEVLHEPAKLDHKDDSFTWSEHIKLSLEAEKPKPICSTIKEALMWENNARSTLNVYKKVFQLNL